jgi:hypothetical protein
MGNRYEALIVVTGQDVSHRPFVTSVIGVPLVVRKLTSHVQARYSAQPRRTIDDVLMPQGARKISKQLGKALAVMYDSQIGWRCAYLYENGAFIREYSEDDELWVL